MHVANAQVSTSSVVFYILEYVNEKLVAGRRQSRSGKRERNLGQIEIRDVKIPRPGDVTSIVTLLDIQRLSESVYWSCSCRHPRCKEDTENDFEHDDRSKRGWRSTR